jgi:hypothetical protein
MVPPLRYLAAILEATPSELLKNWKQKNLNWLLRKLQLQLPYSNPRSFESGISISVVDLDPDTDPELFAGSGSGLGSGINHLGSGSGQYGSGMNLILNFSVKK